MRGIRSSIEDGREFLSYSRVNEFYVPRLHLYRKVTINIRKTIFFLKKVLTFCEKAFNIIKVVRR